MKHFRCTLSFRSTLLAVCALLFATAMVPAGFWCAPALASGKGHSAKRVAPKPCYETGTFKRKAVRVPTNCSKPKATDKCYLDSTYDGRSYRQQIDCVTATKPGTAGASAVRPPRPDRAARPGPAAGGSRRRTATKASTGRPHGLRSVTTPRHRQARTVGNCSDGSGAYCADGTDLRRRRPASQAVVCLPDASVPASGVCDDGSMPTPGHEADGTPICADGDDAYSPATRPMTPLQCTCDDAPIPATAVAPVAGRCAQTAQAPLTEPLGAQARPATEPLAGPSTAAPAPLRGRRTQHASQRASSLAFAHPPSPPASMRKHAEVTVGQAPPALAVVPAGAGGFVLSDSLPHQRLQKRDWSSRS